ncbi:hypothetical protein COCMIDRAFT_105806 [Bipolaris oryzae ATCC 44560]|uniref:Uncharacterized protein n=1 Tax=Bipolaris oryzae ATCC 44560 TaxID=930090 RepID=W6YQ80_COCMI|nr:uncharacterized protein COCMIDRAFT_105806 [Bipolaris oryzae ATCC 44560]EUC41577.1 hypothetical protein COCMIDRAFT_105806 [Bipolaris oryzae ATCC 44560]
MTNDSCLSFGEALLLYTAHAVKPPLPAPRFSSLWPGSNIFSRWKINIGF